MMHLVDKFQFTAKDISGNIKYSVQNLLYLYFLFFFPTVNQYIYILPLLESGPESYHPWPAGGNHVLLSDSNAPGSQSETDPGAHSACLSDEKPNPRNLHRSKGHFH